MLKHGIKKVTALVLSLLLVSGMLPLATVAAEIDPPAEENFTILWTTDPQWYSFAYPEIIEQQNDWVVDNFSRMDMRYIIHTGDFVDNPHNHDQWAVMNEQYAKWDAAGLPYGILAGNHDVDGSDHTEFSQYFGKARYENNAWYGGDYDDNFGHYDLMTIEGVEFLFVYLGYNSSYTEADYNWLNSVLKQYPNRIAVLSFHEYLAATGERTANGEKFFQNVVLKNPNVRMVLCGHNYNSTRKVEEVDDDGDGKADRTVFQFMANYQNTTKGGNGFMRFMECDLADGTITCRTYSPYIAAFGSDYEDGTVLDEYGYRDEFTIPFDFSAPAAKDSDDPEAGTVVVTSKLSFALTDSAAAVTMPLVYQNAAESGTVYQNVGVYDRFFSLNAADAFSSPTELNYVVAEYTQGSGYAITQVIKGSSLDTADPFVTIPQNGVVIALSAQAVDENGSLVDVDSLTVGRKVILSKAAAITTPSATKKIRLDVSAWDGVYSVDGTNRLTGNNNWVLYDSLLGDSTGDAGEAHTWDMLFAFSPVDGTSDRFAITAVNTQLGADKDMAIPTNGFVLAVNTYSAEQALRDSLREYFAVGLEATLVGYQPGAESAYESRSILPDTAADWSYDSSVMQVLEEGEAQVFYNTNSQWPSADYDLPQGVTFDPASTALYYDYMLQTGAKANILLFFKDSTTSSYVSGQYLSIQSYFSGATISSGSGDVKGDDIRRTGKIDLSTVTFPDDCYNADGTLTLNAIRIFASGAANTNLYLYDMGLTTDLRDSEETTIEQTIPLMDPAVLSAVDDGRGGRYTYNNGTLMVEADTADGFEVTFDLNESFDVSTLKNWLIDVTATTTFDIRLVVTTAGADASYGFVSDFYPTLCGTLDNGYIAAGHYAKALDLCSCYTWNGVMPSDGITTVKQVRILLAGAGTLTVDALQVSNGTQTGHFADGIVKTDGGIVFETTYTLQETIVSGVKPNTTVDAFLDQVTSDYTVTVYENGTAADETTLVKTGQTVVVSMDGMTLVSYEIAVRGDLDRDGMLASTDARIMLNKLLVTSGQLTALELVAADINEDDIVSTSDVRTLLQALVM